MEQGNFLTIKIPISKNQYIPITAMFVGKDKERIKLEIKHLYSHNLSDLKVPSHVMNAIW